MSAGVEDSEDLSATRRAGTTSTRSRKETCPSSSTTAHRSTNGSANGSTNGSTPEPPADQPGPSADQTADSPAAAYGELPETPLDPTAPTPEVVPPPKDHHDHHVLIDATEDRWKWRARIRRDPRKLVVYRVAVALAGVVMICLGIVTGPLPGPGGIPLVLLGVAIWSSEFEWALKLMLWFKAQLKRYQGWPIGRKVLFWIIFSAACGSLVYCYMLVIGIPFWMPGFARDLLGYLPGL